MYNMINDSASIITYKACLKTKNKKHQNYYLTGLAYAFAVL